jgi:MFS family permease
MSEASQKRNEMAKIRKLHFPNPVGTLKIVFDKQAGIILISVSILFSCFYVISASLPSQFSTRYHVSDAQLGLLYLPIGVGGIISAVTTGKIIDGNYRRWARKLGRSVVRNKQDDLTDFPIETARLQIAMPMLYLGAADVIAFGWLVETNAGITGPCVCMFVFGFTMIAWFNVMNILLVDIYPGKPASATAANNLVRCWMGAGASAVVIPLVDAVGMGWTCTLAGLIWVGFSPLLLILMRYGPKWRKEQKAKKDARKDTKAVACEPIAGESATDKDLASKEFETDGQLMSPTEADVGGSGEIDKDKDLEAQR